MTWLADTGTGLVIQGQLDESGRFRPRESGEFVSHENAKAMLGSRWQEMDDEEVAEQRALLEAAPASAFLHGVDISAADGGEFPW